MADQYTVVGVEDPEKISGSSASGGYQVVGEEDATPVSTSAPKTPAEDKFEGDVSKTAAGTVPRPHDPILDAEPSYVPGSAESTPSPLSSRYTAAEGAFTPGVSPGLNAGAQIISGAKVLAPGPAPAHLSDRYVPGAAANVQVDPAKEQAVTDIIRGGTTLASPFLAAGALTSPLSSAIGIGTGLAASAGTGAAVHGRVKPETEDLLKELAFWGPSLVGIGNVKDYLDRGYEPHPAERVANATGIFQSLAHKMNVDLPENPTRADVGRAFTQISKGLADAGVPTGDESLALSKAYNAIRNNFDVFQMGATGKGWFTPPEPPAGTVPEGTAPGHRAPQGPIGPRPFLAGPEPVAPAPSAPPGEVSTAASSMARSNETELQAQRVARGMPAVEPAPEPPRIAEVTPAMVEQMAQGIQKLPPEQRAPALLQMHGELTEKLAAQGKVISPDGHIEVVDSPKAASKLVAGWINDKVDAVDALNDAQNAKAAKSEKAPADTQSGEAMGAGRVAAAKVANAPKYQVVSEEEAPAAPSYEVVGEEPAQQRFAKTDKVTFAGSTATVDHMSSNGVTNRPVLRVTFDKPTTVPWSAKPVTKTAVPPRWQSKVQAAEASNAETKQVQPAKQQSGTVPSKEILSSGERNVVPAASTAGGGNVGRNDDGRRNGDVHSGGSGGPGGVLREPNAGGPADLSTSKSTTGFVGEIIPPADQLKRIKDELRGQYPGNSEDKIDKAAREQLAFENAEAQKETENVHNQIGLARKPAYSGPRYEANKAKHGEEYARAREDAHAELDAEEKAVAEKPTKYKLGSTQANIDPNSEAHEAIELARSRISKDDLAGDGKEIGSGGNHVTVRYGIKGDDTAGIKKFLSEQAPFEATLGKTEKFPPSEHSDGAAPIIAPIESPELHRLNSELEKHGEFSEPSFKEYAPHATLAYVKPEKADRYVGMDVTHGKKFTVDHIAISKRDGSQELVKLEGKGETKAPVTETKDTTKGTTPATSATVDRESQLAREAEDLKSQRKAKMDEMLAHRGYDDKAKQLRDEHNELLKAIGSREDELARLRGEPTQAEKREAAKTSAAKSFADRPEKAMKYGDLGQGQHWQVIEPDYIEKRFIQEIDRYKRAIPEQEAKVRDLGPKIRAQTRAIEESSLQFWTKILADTEARDPRRAQKFKEEYRKLVKEAVSHGSPVPQAVIDQLPEFATAQDARERYEKGRHTSFANRSAAINDTMQKEEGFKVKRQDGKPITDEQVKEISGGVDDMVKVLGPELRDMMRGTDLTISHTSGKHPFLSDAGGQYHPTDRTISAGIDDFLGRPVRALAHETGHWLDFEAGRVLNTKALIRPKSGGPSTETRYISEADRSTKPLYELARRTMSNTRQAEKMVKTVKLSNLPDGERAAIERAKVVLGPYWHEPRELWARMFEQYIATELGTGSLAAESPERYQNTPAWWTTAAWEKIKPLFEEALKSRMDAMRERYAPTTIEGTSAAEPPTPPTTKTAEGKTEAAAEPGAVSTKIEKPKSSKPGDNNDEWQTGQIVTFTKAPPGSYLRANEPFRVASVGKRSIEFRNVKTGAGTSENRNMLALAEYSKEPEVPERFKPVAQDLAGLEAKYDALGTPNYVSGDKVKELLPEWKNKANRAAIEETIHPDASKVAFDLFRRKLSRVNPGDNVLLVTGPVAAGKTTSSSGASEHAALTYEVNLSSYPKAKEHIDAILARGAKPEILYVHTTPELSAERRALRAIQENRPVGIDRSTQQHIDLPRTLARLAEEYKGRLHIDAIDNSKPDAPEIPVEKLSDLAYPKGRDELLSDQQRTLDELHTKGAISDELHGQLSSREIVQGNDEGRPEGSGPSSRGSTEEPAKESVTPNDLLKDDNLTAKAIPPGGSTPVAGMEKTETPPPEPTKAEETFIADLKKRVEKLKNREDELAKETAAPAAYYQDSAKNAAERDQRRAQIEELSEVRGELKEIYAAHKWELAREVKPLKPEGLPDVKKNEHAFYREYFTQSLQPALDAWKSYLGDRFAGVVKNDLKNLGTPAGFPEHQLFVDIPGDGKFLVNNTPKVLATVIRGAVKGFAKPSVERTPTKPAKINLQPSEPAKWHYLIRMEEEAMDGRTEEEHQAAVDTIGNILDFSPTRQSPAAGTTVEYHGEPHIVVGKAERNSARHTILIPSDSDIGKQVQKWIDDGKPKKFGFDAKKAEDAEIEAPNLLLKPISKSGAKPESLIKGESGTFEPGKIGEAVTREYDKEIAPALEKLKLTYEKALGELTHLIAPRAGVRTRTLDSMMRLAGAREKHRWYLEQVLDKSQTLMDKMPQDEQVAFVDRYKLGDPQPTPVLTALADFMAKTDEATYRAVVETQVANLSKQAQKLWDRMKENDKNAFLHAIAEFKGDDSLEEGPLKELADALLNYKQDHYRVLWKVIPGSIETSGTKGVRGRRPLQGTKGFLKRSTLATMSEGVDAGGEPIDWNPVRMFQLAQADSWRYITAMRMWKEALDMGERVFVGKGKQTPDGFRKVEDKIGNVRFPAASGEGMIDAGHWAMAEPRYRLLKNMLGHDHIRESTFGGGLMAFKNNLTGYRLALSPFHAVVTTVSSWAGGASSAMNQAGYGVRHASPTHLVQGVRDLIASPLAPYSQYRLGSDIVHYATDPEAFLRSARGADFISTYPEAAEMVDDLFSGGAKMSLHEDERLHGLEGLRQAIANDRYIAALVKSPFALNQQVMRPLFGYYIPRLKLATFFKDYAFELQDRAADLAAGKTTRGAIARKVWDTTENIYGQMNWDARWWDRTFKSVIQLLFRSFTWFAGNGRLVKDAGIGQTRELLESAKWWHQHLSGGGGAAGGGNGAGTPPPPGSGTGSGSFEPMPSSGPIPRLDPAFSKILGLFLVYAGASAALQYALTREKPKDVTDLLAPRIGGVDAHGNPRRVTIPAIVLKDAMSLWGQGKWNYLRAKESDMISGLLDVVNNEDFRHTMIHDPSDSYWKQRYDDAAHVLGSPMSVSNFLRDRNTGQTRTQSALGFAGFSPAPSWINQSPLERKLSELEKEKPPGPITPSKRAELDLRHTITGALRSGDDAPLEKAIADGTFTYKEGMAMRAKARLDPLEARIKGLWFMEKDAEGYRQLWELSETKGIRPEERRTLDRMLIRKRAAMFRKNEAAQVHSVEASQ